MQEERKLSEYNSAISQIYRLDALLQQANYNSINGLLAQWNWVLDAIWRELSPDATAKEHVTFYKFRTSFVKNKNKRDVLNQILNNKEVFLRRLINVQGKGTKYSDPDQDSMEA